MSDKHRLEKFLKIAVPLWVLELKEKPIDTLLPRTEGYASFIGAHGDDLQYGGKYAKDCFNKVAEGLAILSMVCPGGVDFGDIHFEYPHKDLNNGKKVE